MFIYFTLLIVPSPPSSTNNETAENVVERFNALRIKRWLFDQIYPEIKFIGSP